MKTWKLVVSAITNLFFITEHPQIVTVTTAVVAPLFHLQGVVHQCHQEEFGGPQCHQVEYEGLHCHLVEAGGLHCLQVEVEGHQFHQAVTKADTITQWRHTLLIIITQNTILEAR